MSQKIVTYEVAKAIVKAGYPNEWAYHQYFYNSLGVLKGVDEDTGEPDEIIERCEEDIDYNHRNCIPAPTYVDVWFWLWRKKNIQFCPYHNGIEIDASQDSYWHLEVPVKELEECEDPEKAIEIAILHLVKNNYIK